MSGVTLTTKAIQVVKKAANKQAERIGDLPERSPYETVRGGPLRAFLRRHIEPWYFKFYRGPLDRFGHAQHALHLRKIGLMADDNRNLQCELHLRAYMMLPKHLKIGKERRLARANWLVMTGLEQSVPDMNYDPTIPYLAPYLEETKFIMQEEEELLGFHQYHRKLGRAGVSGFGEKQMWKRLFANWTAS